MKNKILPAEYSQFVRSAKLILDANLRIHVAPSSVSNGNLFRILCNNNDLTLATDDGDCETNGIVYITANSNLLGPRIP